MSIVMYNPLCTVIPDRSEGYQGYQWPYARWGYCYQLYGWGMGLVQQQSACVGREGRAYIAEVSMHLHGSDVHYTFLIACA
jgi:hypothetical protein